MLLRRVTALAAGLAVALAAAPARGATTVATTDAPTEVSSFAAASAWSERRGDGYRLMVRTGDGGPRELGVGPRGVPFDVDLGPDEDGRVVAVYSRCAREPRPLEATAPLVAHVTGRGCDLYLADLESGRERRLQGASSDAASEVLPSIWRGEVAFARVYPSREGLAGRVPYLYRRSLGTSAPSRRQAGGARGASGLPGPTSLDLYGRHLAFAWMWEEDGRRRSELRLNSAGREPLVLDAAASRRSIARHLTPQGAGGRIAWGFQRVLNDGDGSRSLGSGLHRYRIANRAKDRAPAPALLTAAAWSNEGVLFATAPSWRAGMACPTPCRVTRPEGDVQFQRTTAVLPGGGRAILPGRRVVAFYGAPQDDELGVLGQGSPDRAARRLRRFEDAYERHGDRPVLPAFELIATVVQAAPGRDGLYRFRQPESVIRRYLEAARRHDALLILDLQPGRADFMDEVRALREFLLEPDVGLALDPEWSMASGEVPGQTIGGTDAATINRVSAYLAQIVRQHHLPQKLLLVHRFTDAMIDGEDAIRRRDGVAIVENVDGFGSQAAKRSKYRRFTSGSDGLYEGFKVFFSEDIDPMNTGEVLSLRPPPDVVVYE